MVRQESRAVDPYAADDVMDTVSLYVHRRGAIYWGSVSFEQCEGFTSFPVRNLDGTSSIRRAGYRAKEVLRLPLEFPPHRRPTTSGMLLALSRELALLADSLAGNPSPSEMEGQAELF